MFYSPIEAKIISNLEAQYQKTIYFLFTLVSKKEILVCPSKTIFV